MFKFFTGSGSARDLSGVSLAVKNTLSFIAAIYLIFAVLYYPEPILHRSIAFGLFYAVIFIGYTSPGERAKNRIPVHDWILASLSLSVSIYVALNLERITTRMEFFDPVTTMDIIFCMMTVILLLEGTRRIIGPWLPGLSILALGYLFWGHLLPGKFGHLYLNPGYITEGLFLSQYGIWGSTIGIATGSIMVFLMFGTLFKNTGAGDFLFDFISRISGNTKGGIAKVAILTSAMFGMISGSPLTNVTTTGAMTIPAMKKSGYGSEYSASIESCSSVGGIFMPPVMGAVAFLMADVVGIQYGELIKRAIIPALIYFAALLFAVDFRARRMNIGIISQTKKTKFLRLMLSGYNFFIPLIYLITRLVTGGIVARVGLETIVIMIILGIFNKKKPVRLKTVTDSLKSSINSGVLVVSTLAMCGVLVGVIDITGVASKLSSYLMSLANISVILTLLAVMILTLFLGLAMNISSSYIIAAVLGAPVLIKLGFNPLSVHMFILFFASMATITPPVAITSFAAAAIADASPMKVGFLSMKVGLVAYILPFVFLYNPAILLYGTFFEIIFAVFIGLMGAGIIAMGLEGWCFGKGAKPLVRVGFVAAGIMTVTGNSMLLICALCIMGVTGSYYLIESINIKRKIKEVDDENC